MTPDDFKARLNALPDASIELASGDHILNPEMLFGDTPATLQAKLRPAAVLIGLQGDDVLLTVRSAKLRTHSGQIAFPGGTIDPEDTSPEGAALREANEEIGLEARDTKIIKRLPDYLTRSGFAITPIIADIAPKFQPIPSPDEVAEVFSVPLDLLMDARNHQMESRFFEGKDRYFYAIPYQNYRIWGVTAGIIHALAVAIEP